MGELCTRTWLQARKLIYDRHFVPNITMGFPVLQSLIGNMPDLYADCHMMVSDPAKVCYHVLLERNTADTV
jgi:pentose-5-phosphate-3-epimerase